MELNPQDCKREQVRFGVPVVLRGLEVGRLEVGRLEVGRLEARDLEARGLEAAEGRHHKSWHSSVWHSQLLTSKAEAPGGSRCGAGAGASCLR